mmetsp:Transcript_92256/g.270003  ORF Transcript_92256/g.270003 Transcript_92256/m.270003 type:complete len:227 (+) Transcript_92256:911-1591(+)
MRQLPRQCTDAAAQAQGRGCGCNSPCICRSQADEHGGAPHAHPGLGRDAPGHLPGRHLLPVPLRRRADPGVPQAALARADVPGRAVRARVPGRAGRELQDADRRPGPSDRRRPPLSGPRLLARRQAALPRGAPRQARGLRGHRPGGGDGDPEGGGGGLLRGDAGLRAGGPGGEHEAGAPGVRGAAARGLRRRRGGVRRGSAQGGSAHVPCGGDGDDDGSDDDSDAT